MPPRIDTARLAAALQAGPRLIRGLARELGCSRNGLRDCAQGERARAAGVRLLSRPPSEAVVYLEGQDPAALPAPRRSRADLAARIAQELRRRGPQGARALAAAAGSSAEWMRLNLRAMLADGRVIVRTASGGVVVWALPGDGRRAQEVATQARKARLQVKRDAIALARWGRGPLARTALARLVPLLRAEAHTAHSAAQELGIDEGIIRATLDDLVRVGAVAVERRGGAVEYSMGVHDGRR